MASRETPTMEGYLEKHNTGVSRFLGKTKFWCTLQGSCLVYCKESKRSSVVESLLLGDAQMVKKTNNDRLGTQFEIVMKKHKTYVFTATSADECSSWVKHLQQAMIHHEPSSQRSQLRRQVTSDTGYEEITINDDSTTSLVGPGFLRKQISVPQSGVAVPQSGIYAEVVDAVRARSDVFPIRNFSNSSSAYAEVADVITPRVHEDKSGDTDSVVYRDNSLYVRNKEREELERMKQDDKNTEDIANGYSTLDSCKDMVSKTETEVTEEKETEQLETMPVYAKVNKPKKSERITNTHLPSQQLPDVDENGVYEGYEVEVREGAAIENLDKELKRLPESSDLPEWISVTADDKKPVEDLKAFLANNSRLCRPSYIRLADDHDPVQKLKDLIQEIG